MARLDNGIISTTEVSRVFGSGDNMVTAVDRVTVDVESRELLALVGRSGSGKTTLMNLMAGLDQPSSGSVTFQGRDLSRLSEKELVGLRRHGIGFIFQSFGLIPLLSAFENVELPLHISGVPWRERRRRALETLELVGLGPRAKHRPYELSGGRAAAGSHCPGVGNRAGSGVCRRAHRGVGLCDGGNDFGNFGRTSPGSGK